MPLFGDDLTVAAPTVDDNLALRLQDVSLRPAPEAEIVLSDVSLSIMERSTVMVTRPVGTRKTTILKATVGELLCGTEISLSSQDRWHTVLSRPGFGMVRSKTPYVELRTSLWMRAVLLSPTN